MKRLTFFGVLLLIIGTIITLVSLGANGFHLGNYRNRALVEKNQVFETSKNVSLDVSMTKLNIQTSPDDKIHLSYLEDPKSTYRIQDGEKIEIKESRPPFVISIRGFFPEQQRQMTLSLPKNYNKNITVDVQVGDLSVDGISFQNLDINTGSGDVVLQNLKGNSMVTNNSLGDLTLANINLIDTLKLSASSGKIDLNNVGAKTGDMDNSLGNLTLQQCSFSGDVKMGSSSGNVTFQALDVSGNLTIDNSLGDVKGSLKKPRSYYTIHSSVSLGNNNLGSSKGGQKNLTVKTSSGDVEIDFAQ